MRWPTGPRRRDAIVAAVLMGVAGAALLEAASFPSRAAGWPMLIWGLLLVFGLVLLLGSFRRPPGEGEHR
jgi:hypothetical protein